MTVFSSFVFLVGIPACSGSAVRISDLAQGSEFNQCIQISDFTSKGLGDWVTVTARQSNGCCPAGYIPGIKQYSNYWTAMVSCGFKADGTLGWSTSNSNGVQTCTYNKCYVVKMGVTCGDGSPMRLNGCCPAWSTNCKHYKKSQTLNSVSTPYCTSYAKNYKLEGTSTRSDDIVGVVATQLSLTNFRAYTACAGAFASTNTGVVTTNVVNTGIVSTGTVNYVGAYALNWIGENPGVLAVCQGDCDNDASCPGSSVCVKRQNGLPAVVPGCSIGDSGSVARRDTDYCSNPGASLVNTGIVNTGIVSTGTVNYGAYALNYIGENPSVLTVCQGDCDNDASCPGNSVCVRRSNGVPAVVSGCSIGDSGSVARRDTDYCSNPVGSTTDMTGGAVRSPGGALACILLFALRAVLK